MRIEKSKLVLIGLFILFLKVGPVNATWTTESIGSIHDDLFITESRNVFQYTNYVTLTSSSSDIYSFLAFRSVQIPDNSQILTAYLELETYGGTNETGPSVTVYGIKTGNLDVSWNPPPDLINEPITSSYTNYDLENFTGNYQRHNITVTDIISEIYNQYSWGNGNDIGFAIYGVQNVTRAFFAYDSYPSRVAKLYVEYGENTTTTHYYRNATITITDLPGLTPFTGFFQDAGTLVDLIYLPQNESARSNNWIEVNTPAYELGNLMSVQQTRGVVYNDTLFMYGLDDDGTYSTHIYSAPLDNLTDWTKVKQMQTVVDSSDWFSMGWWSTNTSIYCVTAETGGITFRKVNVTDWTASSEVSCISGYGSGSQSGSAILIDDYGTIYVAGGVPGPTDSTTKCAYGYSTDGGATWTMTRATGFGVYSGYPQLAQMYNMTFLVYAINSPVSYVYKYINQTDLASGWSSSATLDSVSNMNYNDLYVQPDYFATGSTSYRDVIVSTNYQTGASETRLSSAYIYLNSSGIPNVQDPGGYSSLGNHTGVDKQFNTHVMVDDRIYSLYADSGSPYYTWWADPAYSQNSSFTFYNTNPTPSTSVYQAYNKRGYGLANIIVPDDVLLPGGQSITVTINGTTLNNTCIDQATTLEEAQACIDAYLGQDPTDPDPPGTSYPPDGPGALTRFNTRFWIWLIGWVCVIAPLMRMTQGNLPVQYWYGFMIMILAGIALIWSSASI